MPITLDSKRASRAQQLAALLRRRALIADGAMGTELQVLGLAPGECGLRWNIEKPEQVRRVHQRYLEAGADLLTTNTFSGTSLALAAHGLEARTHELNRAGAVLAREVAGERAFVLGDIGPFGGLLEPWGETAPEVATEAFRLQASALVEGGVDAILVETMSDPAEAALAIAAARAVGAQCVFATFAFQHSGPALRTMMGSDVEAAVSAALEAGADVVGANCGTELSLDDYAALAAELMRVARGHPVIVQPNAGSPVLRDGRIEYVTAPAAFGAAAKRFRDAGARIIGGCCGTTPGHIAAVKGAL